MTRFRIKWTSNPAESCCSCCWRLSQKETQCEKERPGLPSSAADPPKRLWKWKPFLFSAAGLFIYRTKRWIKGSIKGTSEALFESGVFKWTQVQRQVDLRWNELEDLRLVSPLHRRHGVHRDLRVQLEGPHRPWGLRGRLPRQGPYGEWQSHFLTLANLLQATSSSGYR